MPIVGQILSAFIAALSEGGFNYTQSGSFIDLLIEALID
jgi:hypothetical protein